MGYWYDSRLDLWSVSSCIQSEYRKIPTRNNSVFGHFSRKVKDLKKNQFKEKSMKNLTSFVDDILSEAKDKDVVFLVVGDPFGYEGIFLLLIVTFF